MCSTCGCGQSEDVTFTRVEPTRVTLQAEPAYFHAGHYRNENAGDRRIIQLEQDILAKNNVDAKHNRDHFESAGILAINLVSSPGSGKTTLLETTLVNTADRFRFYVIEGDQQTRQDADRIAATGSEVVQINTGKGCHLDARMVHHAVHELNPAPASVIFIENVGNLVCPALFDLGETFRVVIISVTEGDDKPLKYPDMFASSHLCIINKTDLVPYVKFSVEKTIKYACAVNPRLKFISLSATTGENIEQWYAWLTEQQQILYNKYRHGISYQPL